MKVSQTLATLVATTALTALAAPAPAQNAPRNAAAPDAPATTSDDSDIIVTANKREQRLQDVPITVTVVDGAQLTRQNVNEVTDLTRSAPSLNSAGPFGALSIRGVGSISFSRSSEGSVGVVVDGVALANTSTSPPQLFDAARVEILDGPQGTLFGRNSSAGVLNIVTNAPDPSRYEVVGHADIGSRNTYVARALVNIPVADNAALRISGSYNQAPEVMFNRFDNSYNRSFGKSGRARFKWDPTGDITINLIGDYTRFDRRGGSIWTVYKSTPGSLLSQRLATCGVVVGPENQQGCTDGGNRTTTQSYGFSGQVDMKIGGQTLTSISAYRAYSATGPGGDTDSVAVNRLNKNQSLGEYRNYSQELRLTSPSGGLFEYVLGLYFFDGALDTSNDQLGAIAADRGIPFLLGQRVATKSSVVSKATFGQATINLTPAFRLIAGARYGSENVHAFTRESLEPGAFAPFAGAIGTLDATVKDTYFSYRGGAQYDLARDLMVYATYTRGYKGPAVNDQVFGAGIPSIVRPEIPHAAEIGLKSSLFDRRLAINLAGFYNKVDDFQAQFYDATVSQFVFGNAPSLTSKGISVNIIGRPARGLTLNVGGLYNEAKYGNGYVVQCALGQTTVAQGCMPVRNAAGVVTGTGDDAGGNRLAGSPQWKATGSAEYATRVGDGFAGFVQADVSYTSRINFTAANSPELTNAPAAIFGGRIGVRTDRDGVGISVFARNVFDTYRPQVRFETPTGTSQGDPFSLSQISGPESRRVIGVSLDARF